LPKKYLQNEKNVIYRGDSWKGGICLSGVRIAPNRGLSGRRNVGR